MPEQVLLDMTQTSDGGWCRSYEFDRVRVGCISPARSYRGLERSPKG
jgi:hypothetical protein